VRVYLAGPLFTPYERSFIDECATRLRADGIEVFVPHENALAAGDTSATTIFAKDWKGLSDADAVVAVLDGSMVDDGTACEIGIFYALTYVVMFAIPLFGLRTVRPGPPMWLRLASLSGLLMTVLYIVLSVFPIIKVESVSTFALKITMMIVVMNLFGIGILLSAGQRSAATAAKARLS